MLFFPFWIFHSAYNLFDWHITLHRSLGIVECVHKSLSTMYNKNQSKAIKIKQYISAEMHIKRNKIVSCVPLGKHVTGLNHKMIDRIKTMFENSFLPLW